MPTILQPSCPSQGGNSEASKLDLLDGVVVAFAENQVCPRPTNRA